MTTETTMSKPVPPIARVEMPVREMERAMPDVAFTGYSAYKLRFNDVPADYSEIYVYANDEELEEINKRFGLKGAEKGKRENLFILKKDELMKDYKQIPLAQVFVDLWNLKEWYAKEFVNSFEKRGLF